MDEMPELFPEQLNQPSKKGRSSAGLAGNLPDRRTVGANSSLLMHRTIETLEIGKLSEERERLNDKINETEDADEGEALEGQVAEIAAKLEKMKKCVRNEDQKYKAGAVEMLTEANRLDQSPRRGCTEPSPRKNWSYSATSQGRMKLK